MENNKRLIDADALIEEYCNGCDYMGGGFCSMDAPVCGTVETIKEAPTVDAVEVVRCRECNSAIPVGFGFLFCKRIQMGVNNDGFCDCGKRRKEVNSDV